MSHVPVTGDGGALGALTALATQAAVQSNVQHLGNKNTAHASYMLYIYIYICCKYVVYMLYIYAFNVCMNVSMR